MKKQLKRITAVMLVVVTTTLLLFRSSLLPAFAQTGAGDQIRASVDPLYTSGQGTELVLTSNWQDIDPGEQDVYRFDYSGGDQPIKVWLDAMPADSVQFQVWTDELLTQLNSDPNLGPLAVGAPISTGSEFSIWQGNDPNPKIYYITVRSNATSTARYLLNISSPGLSPNQPGVATPVPAPTTPVPPPPTVVPPGPSPTATALPNVTVLPTDTPLPNVPVVSAATPSANVAVVIAPALNVRSGPSTLYPVITTVPAGTILTALGRNDSNTWIAVQLPDGTQGWVTRSLTDYIAVAPVVLTAEPLPTPTPMPGVTATPTPDTTIVLVQPPTPAALDGDWHVIKDGETHWYTFQYRGGGLSVHVWMDLEPDQGAVFNILDQETAQSILAGVAPNVVNAVGRGMPNPVEPGYLLWESDFPEADIYYVMVQYKGPGDVVYAIHAAGPGLSCPVPNQ